MTDSRETDRLPPGLVRALRELPGERAAPGFTRRVLDGLGERPAGGFRTALSLFRPAVAAAVAVCVLAVALALALAGPVRERADDRERAALLRSLAAERARLADELAEIRRLSREPLPVVYLGGDEAIDLVVDPHTLSDLTRQVRSAPSGGAVRPTPYQNH